MDIKKFTINDLMRFSGIKAHTLRVWERRYGLLNPVRTSNNSRLYSIGELKKILDIALLKQNGFSISRIANEINIEEKIYSLSKDYNKWQKAINDLTISMYCGEPEVFESVLGKLLLIFQMEVFMEKIIFPFLQTTQLLWTGHRISEEHIVVTAIRKKLMLAIESINKSISSGKTVLLFLPDTKQIDLGLLYCNYFLKRRNVHVLYLGNDITIQNLKSILHFHPPTFVFTYLPNNHHFPVEELLDCMTEDAPFAKLIIGSYSLENSAAVFSGSLIQMSYQEALEFIYTSCK